MTAENSAALGRAKAFKECIHSRYIGNNKLFDMSREKNAPSLGSAKISCGVAPCYFVYGSEKECVRSLLQLFRRQFRHPVLTPALSICRAAAGVVGSRTTRGTGTE
jgi:hypothetical protein